MVLWQIFDITRMVKLTQHIELFRNIKLLVENARKAKPNIKIALGNVRK